MRYDTEHKVRTRRSILTEAANAIRTSGPDKVGVAEIMSALGLTHGGFYAHFKSKDDLVAQSITQMFDESLAWLHSKTDGHPPAEALARYVDAYLSRAHRDARGRGCPLAALAGDLPRLPQLARERFTEGAERVPAEMAALLRQTGAKNAEALADSAVAEMAGALALARAVTDPERSHQILRNSRAMVKARLGLKTEK
jgi:TetR/AcrR family transcriptional repressor of nem operon